MSSHLNVYFHGSTQVLNDKEINSTYLRFPKEGEIESNIPSNRHSSHFRHLTFGYKGRRCSTLDMPIEEIRSIATLQIGLYANSLTERKEKWTIAITPKIFTWKEGETYRIDIVHNKNESEENLPFSISGTLTKDRPEDQEKLAHNMIPPLTALLAHTLAKFANTISNNPELKNIFFTTRTNIGDPCWAQLAISQTIQKMTPAQLAALRAQNPEYSDELATQFEKALKLDSTQSLDERIETLSEGILATEIHCVKKLGVVLKREEIENIARRYFYSIILDDIPKPINELIESLSKEFADDVYNAQTT